MGVVLKLLYLPYITGVTWFEISGSLLSVLHSTVSSAIGTSKTHGKLILHWTI